MKSNKKYIVLIIVGIVILAGIGYFLFGSVEESAPTENRGNVVSFNGSELKEEKDGQLIWSVKADTIEMDPKTKAVTMKNITGTFNNNGVTITMTAPEGHVSADHSKIDISGGVKGIKSDGGELSTDAINFDNTTKKFTTPGPFSYRDGDNTITGDKLEGDMVLNQVKAIGHAKLIRN